jgi:HD superfamily phosphodiesterase
MFLTKLESFSKKLHADKDPAHDFLHIKRILALCEKLATPGTDKELLTYAACFHGVLNQEGVISITAALNKLYLP